MLEQGYWSHRKNFAAANPIVMIQPSAVHLNHWTSRSHQVTYPASINDGVLVARNAATDAAAMCKNVTNRVTY